MPSSDPTKCLKSKAIPMRPDWPLPLPEGDAREALADLLATQLAKRWRAEQAGLQRGMNLDETECQGPSL